jgi:hypothetical protein
LSGSGSGFSNWLGPDPVPNPDSDHSPWKFCQNFF